VNKSVTLFACAALMVALLGSAKAADLSMKDAKVGELPKGWTADHTGTGKGSVWKIVEDQESPDGGKAMAQVSGEGSGGFFNLCVADATSYKDLDLTLRFKAMAGKEDQGGGPVWRYKDANNYYVARMNPLEDNFRVYKVVGGKRMQLGSANVKAAVGKWHTIRIEHEGNHIECYLNDKRYLDVKDDAFPDAGKVGLWSKADAQTRFAGIKVAGKK
jgi:3-keto-disaccharide hydrolase